MRILHILDHSLPLQSGYVFRTLGIVNQQRALGWEPVLLTSGKHYAPGPAREKIGDWEFWRTPTPGISSRKWTQRRRRFAIRIIINTTSILRTWRKFGAAEAWLRRGCWI